MATRYFTTKPTALGDTTNTHQQTHARNTQTHTHNKHNTHNQHNTTNTTHTKHKTTTHTLTVTPQTNKQTPHTYIGPEPTQHYSLPPYTTPRGNDQKDNNTRNKRANGHTCDRNAPKETSESQIRWQQRGHRGGLRKGQRRREPRNKRDGNPQRTTHNRATARPTRGRRDNTRTHEHTNTRTRKQRAGEAEHTTTGEHTKSKPSTKSRHRSHAVEKEKGVDTEMGRRGDAYASTLKLVRRGRSSGVIGYRVGVWEGEHGSTARRARTKANRV